MPDEPLDPETRNLLRLLRTGTHAQRAEAMAQLLRDVLPPEQPRTPDSKLRDAMDEALDLFLSRARDALDLAPEGYDRLRVAVVASIRDVARPVAPTPRLLPIGDAIRRAESLGERVAEHPGSEHRPGF